MEEMEGKDRNRREDGRDREDDTEGKQRVRVLERGDRVKGGKEVGQGEEQKAGGVKEAAPPSSYLKIIF